MALLENEHIELLPKLTEEQRIVYDNVIDSVQMNKGRIFFFYGYGGTGKTFLWRTISAAIRSKGDIVLNVASCGITSLFLPGRRTAHSRFKIPLNPHQHSTYSIKLGSELDELIVRSKLIVWDEAPMMHKFCFEALDRTLKDIMKNVDINNAEKPFGGKTIVFGGDFRQILPVIPKGRRQDIVNVISNVHTPEFLNAIKCFGVPNHELILKVGTPVMLLRNIDPSMGLCNGTRLVLTRLGSHVLEAKIMTGRNARHIVLIPRISLTPSDAKLPFKFQRRQFPLMVSYAMTINKSQDQSLSNVGLYFRKPVFSHGQLYVALSRVTNQDGLKILICDEENQHSNSTINVVYKEIFRNL